MNMIRQGLAPSALAASMYSFSLMDSTWPRTIRPTDAQPKKPMTMMTTVRLGPMTATREMANSRNGMASSQSMNRAITESVRPPK